MIIFLYGQDTYRSRQKLNEIIEHYRKVHKSGLNLKFFDGGKMNFHNFRDEIQQTSMFKEKKLAILKNIFSNQDFKENFLAHAKKFINSKDIILFYETNEISESDPLFRFLKKHAQSQEFKVLEGQKLKNWLRKELKSYQVNIKPGVPDKLIDFVGSDLWRLSNEIKKLVAYRKNHKEIEMKDVELLVRPKIETQIFKTIDAIAAKNKSGALSLLHKHLEKGDSPSYLLAMINWQFRNLLTIKNLIEKHKTYDTILKITKLNPFVIKKSYQQAKNFSPPELKKIYLKIFQADLAIKTGKIEPEAALEMLITGI